MSHSDPNLSTEKLLEKLAELGLDKFDPLRKAKRAREQRETQANRSAPPPAEVKDGAEAGSTCPAERDFDLVHKKISKRSRYIPANERHQLAEDDDQLGCTFVDPASGRRCGSMRFQEKDHFIPFSFGGLNKAKNLQFMCSAHNKFRWAHRSRSHVEE
jgi:hypothetical protein